jgi:hypothetical protein
MCPKCNAEIEDTDNFCPMCRMDLRPFQTKCNNCDAGFHLWMDQKRKLTFNCCPLCGESYFSPPVVLMEPDTSHRKGIFS